MTPLLEGETDHPVRVYILPFEGNAFFDGQKLGKDSYFFVDYEVADFTDEEGNPVPILITWPSGNADDELTDYNINIAELGDAEKQTSIPAWAEGKAFSVFLDMRDKGGVLDTEGIYNVKEAGSESFYLDSIDGNGVAGFIVKETPVNNPVQIPLASGGIFSGRWTNESGYWRYEYNYDYRYIDDADNDGSYETSELSTTPIHGIVYEDAFLNSGADTKFSSHSGSYWGKGIKVIWNPYLSPAGWVDLGIDYEDIPSNFYGRYVDVYIVRNPSRTQDDYISDNMIIPGSIVRKARLPIQYGCSNGWWQQTIWRAGLTDDMYPTYKDQLNIDDDDANRYYNIIVDMDIRNTTWGAPEFDPDTDILGIPFRVINSISE
jgi:hypothetical protein